MKYQVVLPTWNSTTNRVMQPGEFIDLDIIKVGDNLKLVEEDEEIPALDMPKRGRPRKED
jgi:hypothetical protein